MKKTIAIVLTALLFLQSCTNTPAKTAPAKITAPLYRAEALDCTLTDGYISISLDTAAVLTPDLRTDTITYPLISVRDGDAYLMRSFPGENSTVAVYEDGDFTAEPRRIPLTGLPFSLTGISGFSANSDGTFSVLGRCRKDDGESAEVLLVADGNGSLLRYAEHSIDTAAVLPFHPYENEIWYVNERGRNLVRINPFTGEEFSVAYPVITAGFSGNFVYYLKEHDNGEIHLYRCDGDTGSKTDMGAVKLEATPITMGYDEVRNILYYADYIRMFACDMTAGVTEQTASASGSIFEVRLIAGDSLYLAHGNAGMTEYRLPETPESIFRDSIALKLCLPAGASGRFSAEYRDVLLAMEADGIGVKIEETEYGSHGGNVYSANTAGSDQREYINTMAKKLLAGDTDFDLFLLDSTMHELLKPGYYENLGAYPLLDYYFTQLNPGYRDLCSIDGTLSFVPSRVTAIISRLKTKFAGGEVFPVPGLLEDIPGYASAVQPHLTSGRHVLSSPHISILMQTWFYQFSSNFMARRTDDESALRDLEFLFEMYHKLSRTEGIQTVMGDEDDQYLNFAISDGRYYRETESLYPVPLIRETYGYPVALEGYAVNPNSSNRETAALFLAYLLEFSSDDARLRKTADPDDSEAVLFSRILENSVRDYRSYEWIQAVQTDSGEIDAEKSAEESFKKLKMIRDE